MLLRERLIKRGMRKTRIRSLRTNAIGEGRPEREEGSVWQKI